MEELCTSSVKSNLSLPQQSALTLHLFLCWRAIKYSSRVSSTAEASLSPWHVLLSFKNTSVSIHTDTHKNTRCRVRKAYISCLKKTDCHNTAHCCTGIHIHIHGWQSLSTLFCSSQNVCKQLAPEVMSKQSINTAHAMWWKPSVSVILRLKMWREHIQAHNKTLSSLSHCC